MDSLYTLDDIVAWHSQPSQEVQEQAARALESGQVLYFPNLSFGLNQNEISFLTPQIMDEKSKNISYSLKTDRLSGSSLNDVTELKVLMKRFASQSRDLLESLIPGYKDYLIQARTSLRPTEIKGRKSSYRKDDTLLHVDSFPSSPTAGQRILRVFTNINHEGKPRVWHLGEPLENVIEKFAPKVYSPLPGIAHLLKSLKITKSYRTPYDHYMLGIHNRMKKDSGYQSTVSYDEIHFPPGSSWIVYTDQVSHAALSGQHVLEQTFHLPVNGLRNPATSPLKQLERFLNKQLV